MRGKSQAEADRTEQLAFAWAHWVMGTNLCDEQKDGDVLSQPQLEYKMIRGSTD